MSDVLFGNNNKAVIKKVANRSFHSNKKRNILAVIAIALTTFLLTAVLTIGFGAKNTMQYSEARLLGTQAHALVQGMTKKQAEQLRANSMFEKVGTQIALAFLENTKQLNVEMDYVDETLIEVRFMTPSIGTIPKEENEVLVSSNVLEDLGIPKKAGETLPVDLKVDGKIEHFDMKVSGIYEPVKDDVGFVMVSKAFMEAQEDMVAVLRKDRENGNYYNADVILKDPSMVEERIGEFIRSIGGNPDDLEAENYVRIAPTPVATQSDGNLAVWMAAGVFGILFMFCGYLLIYNVFDMGVTNDVRQYGLLRTIGMTPKQVKGLVRKQAMYLFLIGTPIGVVLGILLGKGMLPSALQVFVAELGEKNVVVGSLPYLPIIIGSVLFSALTVWISTRKSAKKASRVSPIEAIRYVEQSTGKIKERKNVKGALLPRMAKANVQRNRGRMILVIVSLMLSIILLNSVFIFVGSYDEDIYVEREMRSDFAVYTTDAGLMQKGFTGHSAALPEDVAETVTQRPGVKNVTKMYRNTFEDSQVSCDWGINYEVDEEATEALGFPDNIKEGKNKKGEFISESHAALTPDGRPLGNVYGVSDSLIDKLDIREGEKDKSVLKEKLQNKNGIILIAGYNDDGGFNEYKEARYVKQEVGDQIQFYENGVPTETYTVLAKAATADMETGTLCGPGSNIQEDIGGPVMYMSEEHFKELYENPPLYCVLFDTEEEQQQEMETYLSEYTTQKNTDVLYQSADKLGATVQTMKNATLLIGGLIGGIFALVGIINLMNLIMTNIVTRRHEFASMQSIGMTTKQLRKLVMTESLSYVLRASVIGIVVAVILGVAVVKPLVESGFPFWFMTFHLTILPAILLSLIYIVLALIIPMVSLRFLNRQSIVERLRIGE